LHRFRVRAVLVPLTLLILTLTGTQAIARGGGDDGGSGGGDAGKALTLRVNPAIAVPGGVFAVVLRTYAPRPIRQGQVLIKVGRPVTKSSTWAPVQQPIATLLSAVVFSVRGDSATQMSQTVTALSQDAMIRFQSPSSGINAADGPMIVLRYRLDPSVAPGTVFNLQIDPAISSLVDGQGRAVVLDPRGGTLTVRAPGSPFALEAEGDKVAPGEVAELGVQTFEPFAVSGGRVTLRYDQRLAGGAPAVRMDSRYGRSTFTVDRSRPGRLVIDFQSPNKSLNTIPGAFIAISLPVSANAAVGTSAPVTIDSTQTWLLSVKGRKLPLKLEAGALEVR
jgi:hypothetical protein